MDRLEFYKEQYYKEIDRKNEISNSLSTPIGIISALVAGLFYALTSFDFSIDTLLTAVFIVIFGLTIFFLGISVFNLIKAFSDFHNGFDYLYLADADDLDKYEKDLKEYYKDNNEPDTSDTDFKDYILSELIKATGANQKNNKSKIYHRFLCHKFMISAFICICIMTFPFGINYGLQSEKPKIQKVALDSTVRVNLQTPQNKMLLDSLIIKYKSNGKQRQKDQADSASNASH